MSITSHTVNHSETTIPAPSLPYPREFVLGLRFHALTIARAADAIERFIQERTPCRRITFANAHTVSLCWSDHSLLNLLNESDLVLADGMSIVWGARWLGIRLPGRVAGPDLTEALCARAAEKGYGIFLLGSAPDNLNQLRRVMESRWRGIRIVGMHSPSMSERFSDAESAEIRERIHAASPDILLIGISAPKQEIWLAENQSHLNVPVALAIGAAFDFLSGKIPRAPHRLQSMGLEWLYRLGCEPQRLWKRYLLGNAIFLSHLIWSMIRQRAKPYL